MSSTTNNEAQTVVRSRPLTAVAVSQAIQLPVVLSGSVGYLQAGLTDVRLGSILGTVAALGTAVGPLGATRVPTEALRKAVAWACIAAGTVLLLVSAL